MSESERLEVSENMPDVDAPPETESVAESDAIQSGDEGALETEAPFDTTGLSMKGAEPDAAPTDEETGEAGHGISNATLESMARIDPQAQAEAEAKRTKWERRRAVVLEQVQGWCNQYMADGGFKLGVSLVTAVIAAAIIVIAGIFSDRLLSVVFWRAVVGFFVSGIFMGGSLYWLDRFGIPLFIAKHEDQIQMDWLSEAEEMGAGEETPTEGTEEEQEPGELEELMPPEGEGTPQEGEGAELSEQESAAVPGNVAEPSPEGDVSPDGEASVAEDAQSSEREAATGEDVDGLENAVLDDAFSSAETEEEPPAFSPMTAENLETLSMPEEA